MRIISGIHKGRRITAPKNLPVRPTTDMAKEALFNILRHQVFLSGLEVLELFAGSGNMSYEFASRGAKQLTAVDENINCVHFIQKTAEQLELPIDAVRSDAFQYLERCNGKFDVIFADPPYALEENEFLQIPELVFTRNLLNEGGLLIIEHSKHSNLESHEFFQNSRRYGGTVFSFFALPDEEE